MKPISLIKKAYKKLFIKLQAYLIKYFILLNRKLGYFLWFTEKKNSQPFFYNAIYDIIFLVIKKLNLNRT